MTTDPDHTFAIIRAALRLCGARMRPVARPEPEVYPFTPLDEAMAVEGVPKSLDVEVDKLARVLQLFADCVRVADRNDAPIVPLIGEIFPKKMG